MPGPLDPIRRQMRDGMERAVTMVCNDLEGRAARDAPLEEGTLRGSGDVQVTTIGDRVEGTVSFNTVYAARQHEETSWAHPMGGRAKYLEANLIQMRPRYQAFLAAQLRL